MLRPREQCCKTILQDIQKEQVFEKLQFVLLIKLNRNKLIQLWAVVVVQLVVLLLPTPEICSSNPAISNIYIYYQVYLNSIEKTKVNKKRPGLAQFLVANKLIQLWAVVVVQLVARLIPTPEICSSNPVISNIYIYNQVYLNSIEKTYRCLSLTKRGQDWHNF